MTAVSFTGQRYFFFGLGAIKGPKYAPKHGDASATYWKLHGLEAEIYDKNFVKGLKGNTNSMVILVRGDLHR